MKWTSFPLFLSFVLTKTDVNQEQKLGRNLGDRGLFQAGLFSRLDEFDPVESLGPTDDFAIHLETPLKHFARPEAVEQPVPKLAHPDFCYRKPSALPRRRATEVLV